MIVDTLGNLVQTGGFRKTFDFDPTEGMDERTSVSSLDLFVSKWGSDGSYGWTYTVGGPGDDVGGGLAIAPDGTILVCGVFRDTVDFDPGDSVDFHTSEGIRTAFITRLGPDGSYHWTRSFQETENAIGSGIAVARDGNMVVTGLFYPTLDLDPGPGVTMAQSNGSTDVYVVKLDEAANLIWGVTFGGGGFDAGSEVAIAPDDSIYVSGTFRGRVDFDPGPGVDWHQGILPVNNAFLMKLHPDGSYAWTATHLGAINGPPSPTSDSGVVLTAGFASSRDFDPGEGEDIRSPTPSGDGRTTSDGFVTKLNADGSHAWTYTYGGPGQDVGKAATVDQNGDVLAITIFAETVEFQPGPGGVVRTCPSEACDALLRLREDGTFVNALVTLNTSPNLRRAIIVDSANNLFYAHSLWDISDVDPTCEIDVRFVEVHGTETPQVTKLSCIHTPGDYDNDGDVDLVDVSHFQNCFAGEAARECAPGCDAFDLDLQGSISLADYTQLQPLLTNPK